MNRLMMFILASFMLMSLIISGCASVGKTTQFRYVGFHPQVIEGKDIVLIKDSSGKAYFLLTQAIQDPVDLTRFRRLEEANVFSTQLNHIANIDDLPVVYHNYISAGFTDPETGDFHDFRKNGNWVIDLYESYDVVISQGRVYVRLSDDEKQLSLLPSWYSDSLLAKSEKTPYTVSSFAKFSEIKSKIDGIPIDESVIFNYNWFVVEDQNCQESIGFSIGYPNTNFQSLFLFTELIMFDLHNDAITYRIKPDYGTPRKPIFFKDNIVFMDYSMGYFDNAGNFISENGRQLVFEAVRELQDDLQVYDHNPPTSSVTYHSCFFNKEKTYVFIRESMQIVSIDNSSGAMFSYFLPIENSVINRAFMSDSWNAIRFGGVVDQYTVFFDTECNWVILVNMEDNEVCLIHTKELSPKATSVSCFVSGQCLYIMCNYNYKDAEFLRIDVQSEPLDHIEND